MSTAKMIDLSTAYVKDLAAPEFGKHRVVPHEYGWIVFVPGLFTRDELTDVNRIREGLREDYLTPDWLLPIMVVALQEDAMLINFDQDGEGDERFEEFMETPFVPS
jgi:hypothetical protein